MSKSIKVGDYKFTQYRSHKDEGGGRIRFQVGDTGNFSVSEGDEKIIIAILSQMGKWEKMIGSLSHVLEDLGMIEGKSEVEFFNIDDYKYYAEFERDMIERTSYVYVTIQHKTRLNTSMERFWKLIPNTILWIQFLETISLFGFKGD